MKRRVLIPVLLTAVAMSSASASAQNLSGTWQLSSESPRGTQTQTLTLVVEGATLAGTVTLAAGGRGGGGGLETIEISDATIDGNSFAFTITRSGRGGSFEVGYSGTIDGDTISGTIGGGRGGPLPFTGTRGS